MHNIRGSQSHWWGGGGGGREELLLALLLGIRCPVLKTLKGGHSATLHFTIHHSLFWLNLHMEKNLQYYISISMI